MRSLYPSRPEAPGLGKLGPAFAWVSAIVIAAALIGLAGSRTVLISLVQSATSREEPHSLSAVSPASAVLRHLYILSEVPRPDGSGGTIAGHVTVMDLATQKAIATFNTGVDVDVLPSADGRRLFVASVDATPTQGAPQDYLAALNPDNGSQIWRVPIQDRVKYISGGPSSLALSPDGRKLYVYSYSPQAGAGHVRYWFQVVDTATGQIQPTTIQVPDCGAASFRLAPSGDTIDAVCFVTNDVRFANVQTGQITQTLRIPNAPTILGKVGGIASAAFSSDGAYLFVVTDDFHLAKVDTQHRVLAQWVDLGVHGKRSIGTGMSAVSPDGTRLMIADNLTDASGTDRTGDVHVFDTSTWQEVKSIRPSRMLGPLTLTATSNGQDVYAIGFDERGRSRPDADAVVALNLPSGQVQAVLTRPGEEISGAFIGP